jgi:hypothetical protein
MWWSTQLPPRRRLLRLLRRLVLPVAAAAGLAYGGLSTFRPRRRQFVTYGCAAEFTAAAGAGAGGARAAAAVAGSAAAVQSSGGGLPWSGRVTSVSDTPYKAIPAAADVVAAAGTRWEVEERSR